MSSINVTVKSTPPEEVKTVEMPAIRIPVTCNTGARVRVETQGCTIQDVNETEVSPNVRRIRIQGTTQPTESTPQRDLVEVKKGEDGKSVIRVGDDRFGVSISCDLDNANVVVNTDGERKVISPGNGGNVTVSEGAPTRVEYEVKSGGDNTAAQPATGKDRTGNGGCKKTVNRYVNDDGDEVVETTTIEVTEEDGNVTEKKTVETETHTPQGICRSRKFESKTNPISDAN